MKAVNFGASHSGSPDSPEWHAWRAAGIGGSDAVVIAAHYGLLEGDTPPWVKGIDHLYRQKRGEQVEQQEMSFAMQRGRDAEDGVRARYSAEIGEAFSPMFGEMDEEPRIRASFDGVDLDGDRLLEIKVPGRKVLDAAAAGQIIGYYQPQCAHQGLVAWGHPEAWGDGREFHFVAANPDSGQMHAVVLAGCKLDGLRTLAGKLYDAERDFLARLSEGDHPAGADFLALAAQWAERRRRIDAIEEEMADIKTRLIEIASANRWDKMTACGVNVRRTEARGSVDYQALLRALGVQPTDEQIEAARRPGRAGWTVELAKGGQ